MYAKRRTPRQSRRAWVVALALIAAMLVQVRHELARWLRADPDEHPASLVRTLSRHNWSHGPVHAGWVAFRPDPPVGDLIDLVVPHLARTALKRDAAGPARIPEGSGDTSN